MSGEPEGPRDDGTVTLEGELYEHVRYGDERLDGVDPFSTPCHICDARPGRRHKRRCRLGKGRHSRPQVCRDCRVPIGMVHAVLGCVAQCPRCGGQYASCDCSGNEDAPDDYDGDI